MMKQIYIWIICMSYLLISGCVTEFTPKGIEEVRGLLVVEGTISNDTSMFRLCTSVGLYDQFFESDIYIHNASLQVEGEDGTIWNEFKYQGQGWYALKAGILQPGTAYRLYISYNQNEYYSEFLTPLFTPEIDSISWIKKGKGEPIYICVNTHDEKNQSHYYRWFYKEIWEYTPDLMANAEMRKNDEGIEEPYFFNMATSDNIHYCWVRDSSKVLILGSTDKLSENRISEKRLMEFEPTHRKLRILYYIKVQQTMLRKEAYDYFYNLQKNIESTGGIFSSMPNEMKGNINCFTDPSLAVIGYIEVATQTELDRFIYPGDLHEYQISNCPYLSTPESEHGLPLYLYDIAGKHLYAPRYCFDCRSRYGATKERPWFWPNNHL